MKISKILAVGSFPEMDHVIEAHRESTQVALEGKCGPPVGIHLVLLFSSPNNVFVVCSQSLSLNANRYPFTLGF